MKAFRFRLQRVLELRETEAKTEEAALEHLFAKRAQMEAERDALAASLDRMSGAVQSERYLHPSQLVALDRYKDHVKRETQVWAAKLSAHAVEIEKQKARVIAARGRVKLMEKLREKRHGEWETERDRELDELTSDFSASQWLRSRAV
jgi:flagellar export protein FliJ